MDFERFFENMGQEYKTMFLSLLLLFPMTFADCWKLSPTFPSLDLIPQIILAVGVSVILMCGGFVLNLVFLASLSNSKIDNNLNLPVLIIPTVVMSGFVIIGVINSVCIFTTVFCGFPFVCFIIYIWKESARTKKNKKKKKDIDNY